MVKRIQLPGAADTKLELLGKRIAEHYGVPLEHIRYATYRTFLNGRLTTASRWERLVDGQWVQTDWLPESHRTPPR